MLYSIKLFLFNIKCFIFYNKHIKKIKYEKCKDCIYFHDEKPSPLIYCKKSGVYIEPLHLICFDKITKIKVGSNW